jgi:hypothetical protein
VTYRTCFGGVTGIDGLIELPDLAVARPINNGLDLAHRNSLSKFLFVSTN